MKTRRSDTVHIHSLLIHVHFADSVFFSRGQNPLFIAPGVRVLVCVLRHRIVWDTLVGLGQTVSIKFWCFKSTGGSIHQESSVALNYTTDQNSDLYSFQVCALCVDFSTLSRRSLISIANYNYCKPRVNNAIIDALYAVFERRCTGLMTFRIFAFGYVAMDTYLKLLPRFWPL